MKRLFVTGLLFVFMAVAPLFHAVADDNPCRNLFDNTGFPKTGAVTVNNDSIGFNVNNTHMPTIRLEEGVTYTLSYDIDTNVSTPYRVGIGCGNGWYTKDIKQVRDVTTTNGRVSVTFTPSAYDLSYGDVLAFRPIWISGTQDITYSVSNVQLEKGSTATSYVPYNPLCATCHGIVRSGKWNQLAQNGDFADGTTGWRTSSGVYSISASDGTANIAASSQTDAGVGQQQSNTISGHKIFMSCDVIDVTGEIRFGVFRGNSNNGFVSAGSTRIINSTGKNAFIQTIESLGSYTGYTFGFGRASVVPASMSVKNVVMIDLTDMFGAGNEPVTVAAAEAAIAQRASELGITANNGYYEYYASGDYSGCIPSIKIATTAYNAARFNPVKTDLNSAVATIREIVTKTINQTAAIASLQADKQTRPEDACPAGKKCLLVETEENGVIVPHWFPIIEAPE